MTAPAALQAGKAAPVKTGAHPHAALDRSVGASLAEMTAGLSLHAMIDASSDWAMHLGRAPGRQRELLERAQANWLRLSQVALAGMLGTPAAKPFTPGSYDTRWSHAGWNQPPFALRQQGFLAVQDWWPFWRT